MVLLSFEEAGETNLSQHLLCRNLKLCTSRTALVYKMISESNWKWYSNGTLWVVNYSSHLTLVTKTKTTFFSTVCKDSQNKNNFWTYFFPEGIHPKKKQCCQVSHRLPSAKPAVYARTNVSVSQRIWPDRSGRIVSGSGRLRRVPRPPRLRVAACDWCAWTRGTDKMVVSIDKTGKAPPPLALSWVFWGFDMYVFEFDVVWDVNFCRVGRRSAWFFLSYFCWIALCIWFTTTVTIDWQAELCLRILQSLYATV